MVAQVLEKEFNVHILRILLILKSLLVLAFDTHILWILLLFKSLLVLEWACLQASYTKNQDLKVVDGYMSKLWAISGILSTSVLCIL